MDRIQFTQKLWRQFRGERWWWWRRSSWRRGWGPAWQGLSWGGRAPWTFPSRSSPGCSLLVKQTNRVPTSKSIFYIVFTTDRGLQRDVVYFGWQIAPSYIGPNEVGGGELRGFSGLSQKLYTGAQINFGDLTPYWTYGYWVLKHGTVAVYRVSSYRIMYFGYTGPACQSKY